MKKIKIILFLLIFNVLTISNVRAATNPYNQWYGNNTNCTWYAWKMAYERAGVALPGWGNANTWYDYAKNAGYSVGTVPKANSIAIWTNCTGDCAIYGHVGYVESVSSDGRTLYIKDSSYNGMNGCIDKNDPELKECIANGVSEETDKICYDNVPRVTCPFSLDEHGITQYIYLDNAPKNPVYAPVQNTPKPQEVKKSNNANLKSLTVSENLIEFNKDILEYEDEVEYEVDKKL